MLNICAEHTSQALIRLCQASSNVVGAGNLLLDVLSTLTATGGGGGGASSLLLLGPPGVGNTHTRLVWFGDSNHSWYSYKHLLYWQLCNNASIPCLLACRLQQMITSFMVYALSALQCDASV